MEDKNVSLFQWKELYNAVIELKKLKPWEWMWDNEIFGVQNPETGEVGYCCVMGRAGEHYALAAYRGSEGLEGHRKITSGEVDPQSNDALHCQACLMVSFEDRDYLEQKDRKIIKKLGLKFRGDHDWPMFRNWTPGFFPWFIMPEEAHYILQLIPQVIDVTERFKQDPALLIPPEPGQYLVRVPRSGQEGLIWGDEWRTPAPLPNPEVIDLSLYSSTIENIRENIPLSISPDILEIDYFYSSNTVKENQERPYFPWMMLCVDHETGLILFFHLAPKYSRWRKEFIEALLKNMEKRDSLPGRILVKANGFALFEAISAELEIKIEKVEDLPIMNEVRAHMEQFG